MLTFSKNWKMLSYFFNCSL